MLSSYTVCFNVENKDKHLETVCITSNSAEDIPSDLEKIKSKYISFKPIKKEKKVDLEVLTTGSTNEKFLKLVSTYGDALTPFKERAKKARKQKITIGGATLSVNLVIFEDIYAAYLLKKILNGYKIDKIVIKNN